VLDADVSACLEISSSYRISFALVILNFICIIFSIFGIGCKKFLQSEMWFLKFLVVFIIYTCCLLISNDYFYYYGIISKILSIFFLIYQVFTTISFAHIINIRLFNNLDNNPNFCNKFKILFISFIFIVFTLGFVYTSLIDYFSFKNLIIVLINLILGVLFIFVSISNYVTKKRLLTSIYIFYYTAYLSWSAIISEPENKKKISVSIDLIDTLFGILYLCLALIFVGFFIKKKTQMSQYSSNVKNEEEENEILKNNQIIPDNNDTGKIAYILFIMKLTKIKFRKRC
jgi:Serine incorporator (Serinc)